MAEGSSKHKLISALEDALVNEFRVIRLLLDFSKEELEALTKRDTESLASIVEKKEQILDELALLENERTQLMEKVSQRLGLKKSPPTLAEIFPYLEKTTVERLKHLQEGIVALGSEIRSINHSNLTLAKTALDLADSTQAYLLSLYQPELETYQAPGLGPKRHVAVRSFDQRV